MAISTINQAGLNAPLTLTSPVLTTPNLGTPSALVLTNATGTPAAINLANATALPAAALPTGCVLQVVQATSISQVSTTSTSFVTSNLQASITPRSSSNKIFIFASFVQGNTSTTWNYQTIYRNNSTNLAAALNGGQPQFTGNYAQGVPDFHNSGSILYLDSPATTSATTYTVYFRSGNGTTVRLITDGIPATIILAEIAG